MTRSFYALLLVLWLLLLYAVVSGPLTAGASSKSLTWAEAESIICFDGASWDCDTALLIAFRESRFVPDAYNPGCRCVGLFQLAPVHHARFLARDWEWSDAYDAVRNTAIAYELWLDQGWHPWRY